LKKIRFLGFGYVYVGQTKQRCEERLKQHRDNVRLARQELYTGTAMAKLRAEQRMKGVGGGLVKHATMECEQTIDWEKAGPVEVESNWKARRVKESIQTFKNQKKGKVTLNQCDFLDPLWKDILEDVY
jgi:hypothetical protein